MSQNADLIKRLKAAIAATEDKNKMRAFARRYHGLKGESFKIIQNWISHPDQMTSTEVSMVERALKATTQGQFRSSREIVDHAVTLVTSVKTLLSGAKVEPADVNDSDRMYVLKGVQDICAHFGIVAIF